MRTAFFGAAVLVASTLASPATAQDTADARLSALADAYYDYELEQFGLTETESGQTSQGARMPTVTPQAQLERAAQYAQFLAQLETLDGKLTDSARTDARVLRTLLESSIGDARFSEWEMPFDSDSNFWSYLAGRSGYGSAEEYENYLGRMRDIPRYFAEQTANARAGLARGFSVPAVTLEGRDASIEAYVVDDPERSPFWAPFLDMPTSISPAEQNRLQAQARKVISEQVTPAYAAWLGVFRNEYLPQARTTVGAREFPDGEAFYAQQIRQYTTLDLGAEEIHAIGLEEVARITAEMEKVKTEAGFDGTLDEFIIFLRTDPQFVARTPDELMGVAAYTGKRVDDRLSDYFGFLPRYRHGLRPVDPAIAPFYTAGRGGLE